MEAQSKAWYLSREIIFSLIMLIVGVIQIIGAISGAESFAAGVAAVDWYSWALSAAGLIWGILRVANGMSAESTAQPLRGPFTGGSSSSGAMVALLLASVLLAGCASTQLAPEAQPYVQPIMEACEPICDASTADLRAAAETVNGASARRWALAGVDVIYSGCMRACAEGREWAGLPPAVR